MFLFLTLTLWSRWDYPFFTSEKTKAHERELNRSMKMAIPAVLNQGKSCFSVGLES